MAFQLAFKTKETMLDPYHSFLTPKMVEALSFTQDLLKGEPSPVFTNEDFEEIEKFEEGKNKLLNIVYYYLINYFLLRSWMSFFTF